MRTYPLQGPFPFLPSTDKSPFPAKSVTDVYFVMTMEMSHSVLPRQSCPYLAAASPWTLWPPFPLMYPYLLSNLQISRFLWLSPFLEPVPAPPPACSLGLRPGAHLGDCSLLFRLELMFLDLFIFLGQGLSM